MPQHQAAKKSEKKSSLGLQSRRVECKVSLEKCLAISYLQLILLYFFSKNNIVITTVSSIITTIIIVVVVIIFSGALVWSLAREHKPRDTTVIHRYSVLAYSCMFAVDTMSIKRG